MAAKVSHLCLASQSPRRQELLAALGIPFFIRTADQSVEEAISSTNRGEEAERVAMDRASAKGQAVSNKLRLEGKQASPVLAADTVVHLGKRLFDKPADRLEAIEFLTSLSGKRHGVVTALWLSARGKTYTTWRRTWVEFDALSKQIIEAYVTSGEPFDKAGGYGIQGLGGVLIKSIEGCFYNVMGLPLNATYNLLESCGLFWELGLTTSVRPEES